MTDKDKLAKVRAEIERVKKNQEGVFTSYTDGKFDLCEHLLSFIDSMQEESVSEELNTESMIESYKQRLISQANGVKNSPLIDMCLASYKHGINDTLDTLNLSNIERIGKNWKVPVSEDLEKASFDNAQKNYKEGFRGAAMQAFNEGADWQKQKDANLIFNAKEDGYRLGLATMKQQMMKNAVPCVVECDVYGMTVPKEAVKRAVDNTSAQVKDEVKLIIIKEDCI